jgi:hypothetical protein
MEGDHGKEEMGPLKKKDVFLKKENQYTTTYEKRNTSITVIS